VKLEVGLGEGIAGPPHALQAEFAEGHPLELPFDQNTQDQAALRFALDLLAEVRHADVLRPVGWRRPGLVI
jgi:hypothetical protein